MIRLKLPIEGITIETATLCNARCIICPNQFKPRPRHLMPRKEFEKILQFFPKLKGVALCGMYEPLLDPRLDLILADTERIHPDAEVSIFTNGSLLRAHARFLNHKNLKNLIVSIHGFSKKVYESVMVGLDRDVVYQNMFDLISERPMNDPLKISVSFIRVKQNIHELQQFRNYWTNRVDLVSDFEVMNWRGAVPADILLYEQPKHERACPMYEQPLVIDAYGNVVRCCYDFSFNYGHVLKGGFEKWLNKRWESETYPTQDCKPCLGWHHY